MVAAADSPGRPKPVPDPAKSTPVDPELEPGELEGDPPSSPPSGDAGGKDPAAAAASSTNPSDSAPSRDDAKVGIVEANLSQLKRQRLFVYKTLQGACPEPSFQPQERTGLDAIVL